MLPSAQPLSAPLQNGVRFLHRPLPDIPWAYLAVRCPENREDSGLTTFHIDASPSGVRSWLSAGGVLICVE